MSFSKIIMKAGFLCLTHNAHALSPFFMLVSFILAHSQTRFIFTFLFQSQAHDVVCSNHNHMFASLSWCTCTSTCVHSVAWCTCTRLAVHSVISRVTRLVRLPAWKTAHQLLRKSLWLRGRHCRSRRCTSTSHRARSRTGSRTKRLPR